MQYALCTLMSKYLQQIFTTHTVLIIYIYNKYINIWAWSTTSGFVTTTLFRFFSYLKFVGPTHYMPSIYPNHLLATLFSLINRGLDSLKRYVASQHNYDMTVFAFVVQLRRNVIFRRQGWLIAVKKLIIEWFNEGCSLQRYLPKIWGVYCGWWALQ